MIAFALAVFLNAPVQAQTLAEALERAWSRHPQASALVAREAEAEAGAEIAAGLTPGPAAVSVSTLNDRFNSNRGQQEWEIEMAVPLWLPGQQAARALEAESATAAVAARRAALRLQIAGELRDAWWSVANARNALDLMTRREATARALEADVQRRFAAGELARIDANLAQNERLDAESERLAARAALLEAEQRYRRLTGGDAPPSLVAESLVAMPAPRDDHPKLVALAAAARLAQARQKVAAESRRDAPKIAARVLRERSEYGEAFANSVGVKLTVPFSSGARVREASSAARAQTAEADAELALAQQRLDLDMAKARFELETVEHQLAMAQERRDLTTANLRLAEKSFALGESDLVSLLRVRASAFEAEALFNRQQVARAAGVSRLNQTLGVLP